VVQPANILRFFLLAVVILISIHLGGFPLVDADEGRNGEVGREMAATNDYVMPRLDTMPYVDKPILYFAAEAACMEVLGANELAARLPALLFTFATAAVLFWFARRVFDEMQAWLAAIIFLATPLVIAFSRTVIFDSALTFFVVVALVAFYFAIEEGGRNWPLLAWGAIGFGVLTKGPVAILLPLIIAIPFAIVRKRFGSLWSWGSVTVFAIVIAPWVWAVSRVLPDFLQYVLVTETAQRLATKALKRTGPPWYFIPYLIGGALPWSFVALFGSRREDWRERGARFYVLLWIVIPFVFFSISQSKRPQYILPVMPAVALLVATFWSDADRRRIGARAAAVLYLFLGAALIAAPAVINARHMKAGVLAASESTAVILGVIALLAGVAALALAKRAELALIALAIPVVLIPLVGNPLMNAVGELRSTRTFIAQLRPYANGADVVGVEAFTGSMAFYLGRPITVISPDAEEFTSNYLIRHYPRFANAADSPLRTPDRLAQMFDGRPRVFIVRNNDVKNRALIELHGASLIAENPHFVAYTMRR
jgi:4-amino-4-deoxy-L-arabinose transferase-like glycosyltransferase